MAAGVDPYVLDALRELPPMQQEQVVGDFFRVDPWHAHNRYVCLHYVYSCMYVICVCV
jgi:hypothetical protein